MAKQRAASPSGSRSRSRSRSRKRQPKGSAGKSRRSRSGGNRKKEKGAKHGSRSKSGRGKRAGGKKNGRSRSGARKQSPSRKRSQNRKRSPSRSQSVVKKRSLSPWRRGSPSRPRSPDGDAAAKDSKEAQAAEKADSLIADVAEKASGAPPKPGELVTIVFGARPFGMSPSKDEGAAGYFVAKLADQRPAQEKGVKVGWRVVTVDGKDCKSMDSETIQQLLKGAGLPVSVVFEKPPEEDDDDDDNGDAGSDGEEDILDARADQRRQHSAALGNIDDLPVQREPEQGLPDPIKSWQDACSRGILNKVLVDKLQAAGLKRPTLIQRHAVPIIFERNGYHDIIALAQTGSGKTFAFVIPTVARLVINGAMPRPFFAGKSPGTPLVLVLSPTRELAQQTTKEIEVLAKGTSLSQVCIYGGETLKFQQQRIEKSQIDILCATPGRLIDLIDAGAVSLSFIQSVIFDEADQMLAQSLEVMCAEILTGRDMPEPKSGRQTLLFSATMPQKIKDLCPKILRETQIAKLIIGHYGDDHGGAVKGIKQIVKWVPDESQRTAHMIQDLRTYWMHGSFEKKGRVVIFTNARHQAGTLTTALCAQGFNCLHLHGKLEQHVREEVFDKFRRGQADILVATNVASRGLDFPDISFVVQFNIPTTIDVYTHRIGRTGRAGQVGCALCYMGPRDQPLAGQLIEFLETNEQEVPGFLHNLLNAPSQGSGKGKAGKGKVFYR